MRVWPGCISWSTTETKEPETQPMQMKQERTGISEDDPLVQRLRENILKETGVELDQLLNPSKARGSHTPLGSLHVAEAGSVGDYAGRG